MTNQRMGRACPGWCGDLAAYAVGALDPGLCAAVRGHLRTCPACRAEYEDLVPVVGWLALLSPPAAGARPAACGDRWNTRAAAVPRPARLRRSAMAVASKACAFGKAFRRTPYGNRPVRRPSRRAERMRCGTR